MNKEQGMKKEKVRVRFAPSPTGFLHLGSARTTLFNYLFARKNKGKFILRIDDTDKDRSEKKYEKDILEGIKWLGLDWNEGPYYQSQRTELYQKYLKKLLDSGKAFWCFHTKEELEKEKEEQMKRGEAPRHICCHSSVIARSEAASSGRATKQSRRKSDEIAALAPLARNDKGGKKGIIRFRCPEKKVVFDDLIKGKIEFDAGLLGDIGIAKDEDTPLYNFCSAIDDIEMKITHIIRGEDHISNTPKQILIAEALGFDLPRFGHLPMILGPDKSKLSKRHAAVSVDWYKKEGYLAEALINFLALLGWNPGTEKEIFSLNELVQEFSLERVQKGGAIFNQERLDWLNSQYIRKMNLDELVERCSPYLSAPVIASKAKQFHSACHCERAERAWQSRGSEPKASDPRDKGEIASSSRLGGTPRNDKKDMIKKIVALERERLKKLSEIGELSEYFFADKLDYPAELLIWKKMALKEVKINLEILEKAFSKIKKFDKKTLEQEIMPLTEEYGRGELLWPLRAALSGRKASPGPFEIAEILGKERTLKRIKEAIGKLPE